MRKRILLMVVLALMILTVAIFKVRDWRLANKKVISSGEPSAAVISQPNATASYVCDSGLSVQAAFYAGATSTAPAPGQAPIPGGNVKLLLSDGRMFDLPQTISADGARYATANDSFVFWSKGNGALIMENGQTAEKNCLSVAADPGALPQIYLDSAAGFSLRYPDAYTVKKDYQYQELGPGQDIGGTAFIIPATLATGTNLGRDSYLSVEEIATGTDCTAHLFLELNPGDQAATTTTANGTLYSVASSTGAGAGNRYEETVYAIPGSSPCLAIRYFIHYSVLANYPSGLVKAFDHDAIIKQFDAIRRSLVIN